MSNDPTDFYDPDGPIQAVNRCYDDEFPDLPFSERNMIYVKKMANEQGERGSLYVITKRGCSERFLEFVDWLITERKKNIILAGKTCIEMYNGIPINAWYMMDEYILQKYAENKERVNKYFIKIVNKMMDQHLKIK